MLISLKINQVILLMLKIIYKKFNKILKPQNNNYKNNQMITNKKIKLKFNNKINQKLMNLL